MNSKNVTIAALGGLALAGIGYIVYSSIVNSTPHQAVLTAQQNLAAANANPNATTATKQAAQQALTAAITQLAKSLGTGTSSTTGAPPSSAKGGGTSYGVWASGVRKNADGSTDFDNGDGTFTEIDTSGDATVYNNDGSIASNYGQSNNLGQQSTVTASDGGGSSYNAPTTIGCDPNVVSDPSNPLYDPSSPCYNPSLDYNSSQYGYGAIGFYNG